MKRRPRWVVGDKWRVTMSFRVWESFTGSGDIIELKEGTIIQLDEFPVAHVVNNPKLPYPVMINALVFMEPYTDESNANA